MSRVQTGVRIEKSLLKVLKAIAEYEEVSLGALLERIVLSSFAGARAFDGVALERIVELSRIYGFEIEAPGDSEELPAAADDGPPGSEQDATLAEVFDGLSRMLGAVD